MSFQRMRESINLHPDLSGLDSCFRRNDNAKGNPLFSRTYGFPLEFIPANAGVGMTIYRSLLIKLLKMLTTLNYYPLIPIPIHLL